MRIRLTQEFADKAKVEPGKPRTEYWDEGLPGFGLLVTAAGARSWIYQFRNRTGQTRRIALKFAIGIAEARRNVRVRMGEVAAGRDPAAGDPGRTPDRAGHVQGHCLRLLCSRGQAHPIGNALAARP